MNSELGAAILYLWVGDVWDCADNRRQTSTAIIRDPSAGAWACAVTDNLQYFRSRHGNMHTTISAFVGGMCVIMVVAAWRTPPDLLSLPQTAACLTLSPGDSALAVNDTRTIVNATDSVMVNMRAAAGVPVAHEDSVRIYLSNPACDSAAVVYDSLRAARGDTARHYPIALYRIFGTKVYIGTVLDHIGGYREYVVFDSAFTVKGKLQLGS